MSGTGEIDTPYLGLIKPPVGADQDVWGDRWNTNADTLDSNASTVNSQIVALQQAVAALQNAPQGTPEPVGAIIWWPGNGGWPAAYMQCAGQALATGSYPALFNVLNYYWGGSGGTFNLPDLRGLVLVGLDGGTGRLQGQYGGDRIGGIGGTAVVTLTTAQMPPHQHGGATDGQGQHAHNVGNIGVPVPGSPTGAGLYPPQWGFGNAATDVEGLHYHNISTDVQGGGAGITNVQPGAIGYWIIKVTP